MSIYQLIRYTDAMDFMWQIITELLFTDKRKKAKREN